MPFDFSSVCTRPLNIYSLNYAVAFEPGRAEARNCLWYSVILIIAAGIAQIIEKRKLLRIDTAVIILILFVGVAIVPITVKKFVSCFILAVK